ncbi:SUN domain-containing protein 2 isoform X3 [Electrophorus electricus]|uniref:SUN domain-containing protein 2 isoform X3 n=1 Tax=Electrophorus electricus TaxID=8005 RepID=UPI0015D09F52|nr:SUN domain-containing protein 2 isoform X3 [Electrophorus electricus]
MASSEAESEREMSRRSARLKTSGYYPQDDDTASTCSNGSASPISYKESPFRVFKKKAANRKLVGSSRTSSHASSLSSSQGPYTSELITEDEFTGVASPVQAAVWRRSPVFQASPPLATEPAGFSSGYSSSEDGDYPQSSPVQAPAEADFWFRKVLTFPARAFALLYWWLGPAWYSLTSGISLLDVFLLSRHTAGVRKAILLLFLLLLVFGAWYWYPFVTAQLLHTAEKTMIDPTHLHTRAPLYDHVLDARLSAMKVEIYASLREQEMKWFENSAREMESMLSEIQVLKQEIQRQKLTSEDQVLNARLSAMSDRMTKLSENRAREMESMLTLQKTMQGLEVRVKNVNSQHQRQIFHLRSSLQAASEQLIHRIETQEDQFTVLKKDMDDSVNFDQEVVMRPDLERELEALEKKIIDRLRQQQDKEKRDVWRVVGETLQEEGMGAVAIKEIEHIVHRALSLFRADGTGMADYALESSGASVINTRCSETYRTRSACLSLFGIPLWYHSENPRAVIQPEVYPGKCWAFRGSEGFLVISLSYPVRITHITLEHIPRNLSPTGHIDSAPKDFTVYGMTHEHEEGKLLGSFTYDQDGEPIQTYQVPESPSEVYHLVELRVLSNWGHPEYTCLYRFRVHGLPWSTSQEERRTRESINE